MSSAMTYVVIYGTNLFTGDNISDFLSQVPSEKGSTLK